MTQTLPEGFESLVGEFTLDAHERLDRVEQLLLGLSALTGETRAGELARAKRELHTLKGNAGMMGLNELQQLAHRMEDELVASADPDTASLLDGVDRYRAGLRELEQPDESSATEGESAAATADQQLSSIRVPFTVLDPLLDLIGEMVIQRNRLAGDIDAGVGLDTLAPEYAARSAEAWAEVDLAQEALSHTLDVIQERVMALRMTPLKTVLGSLRRIVHDESQRIGKVAELTTEGGDTPLDKALLEIANEALGHLVRNAVIHGLESPEQRKAAGKPRSGSVLVKASTKNDEVWIEVTDDGAGIDRTRLRALAEKRGVAVDHLADITEVLFESGFTTRESADMGSGRGVGLSAVRDAVQRQSGHVEITSEVGKGTTFLLRLPLSVSIARALLVEVDDEVYALPLTSVVETRRMRAGEGHRVNHAGVYKWRQDVLTLLDLGCHFGTAATSRGEGYVLVVEAAGRRRGLVADHILGAQEVVVKGLDPIVGHPAGVGGSTVLGDGRPILILDPRKLIEIEPFVREAA